MTNNLKLYRILVVSIFVLLSTTKLTSQMPDTFGKVTEFEKNLTSYEKDPNANAIYLYERGDNYFKVINRYIRLVKEYHVKIKILNEKGFKQGTIEIPLYHNGSTAEKVTHIKAVTHNGSNQYNVLPSEIFTEEHSERWRIKKFTFPKLEKGSIIEYSYTITSPYYYNFEGWDFQSSIPKIYSEFNAKIPGNWLYNRALIGSRKLDINKVQIKKNCFHVEGISKGADCEVLKYAMKDIPAFKKEKEFMLAPSNYRSRIDFELSQYTSFNGKINKYTKSWNDVDKEFRYDKDIGRQLTKKGFFEKNVSEKLLTEGTELERAKNIYKFIQQHFNWDGRFSTYGQARVKNAFEAKKGNAWEINMALINLLNAADIPANLMLLSTRQSGLPKKVHPVMSDFNYIVAKVKIKGKEYLLDATEKYLPFGMLPFRALNLYGRVMDFKNESYWQDILPEKKNTIQIRGQVKFNLENHKAETELEIFSSGYNAINKRKLIDQKTEEEYLDAFETDLANDFFITDYKKVNERSTEKKIIERVKFELDNVLNEERVYINPFFIQFFESNPFKLEVRDYPIDFGYPRNYKYQINISIPTGYKVIEIPESMVVNLNESMVNLKFLTQQKDNQIGISFNLVLNATQFVSDDYDALKKIFNHAVDFQKNSLIVIEKTQLD